MTTDGGYPNSSELARLFRQLSEVAQRIGDAFSTGPGRAGAARPGAASAATAEGAYDYEDQYKYQIDRFINDDAYRARLKYAVTRIKAAFDGGKIEAAKLPELFAAVQEYQDLLGVYSTDEVVLKVHFERIDWTMSDSALRHDYSRRKEEEVNWLI
jgi:hypothetical protein